MKIKLSKSQWEEMGKKAGWMKKTAGQFQIGNVVLFKTDDGKDVPGVVVQLPDKNGYYGVKSLGMVFALREEDLTLGDQSDSRVKGYYGIGSLKDVQQEKSPVSPTGTI